MLQPVRKIKLSNNPIPTPENQPSNCLYSRTAPPPKEAINTSEQPPGRSIPPQLIFTLTLGKGHRQRHGSTHATDSPLKLGQLFLTWQCQRNACPFGDRSSSSRPGVPQSPRIYASSRHSTGPTRRLRPRTKCHVKPSTWKPKHIITYYNEKITNTKSNTSMRQYAKNIAATKKRFLNAQPGQKRTKEKPRKLRTSWQLYLPI